MTIEIRSRGTQSQTDAFEASINAAIVKIKTQQSGKIMLSRIESSPRRVFIYPYTKVDRAAYGHNALSGPRNEAAARRGRNGPGRGSNSEISFNPNMWQGDRVQSQADEVLFHELCHSYRQMNGLAVNNQIVSFDNVEEFFAAMVASIYSSENNRPPLGNHGFWVLRNANVLTRMPYSTWINNFKERMPELSRELAAIPAGQASFNPFR